MNPRSPLSVPRSGQGLRHTWLVPGALGVLALACAPRDTTPAQRPNVLFLTVDTLRADHLAPYGYGRPTSPALDGLARSGVVFDSAQASSSWTLPTLASVMTGYYTSTHHCWKRRSRLSPAFDTLPERLRDAGYDTACVVSHVFLARTYGLQQGFVHFDTSFDMPGAHGDKEISSPRVTREGVEWIENQAASPDRTPWFLWLHYFDPHFRYVTHEGVGQAFGSEEPEDRYDGEILFTDEHIGEVLDAVERTGQGERTVVVLFADHGEEFEDHGGLYHGHTLHAELTRVPLIVRAPGIDPGRVAHTVRTVDLMPTVLELVGLGPATGLAGESLVPFLRGGGRDLPALAELRLDAPRQYDSLVHGDWKLIVDRSDGSSRLYRIADDPGEQHDVASEFPEQVERLTANMGGLIETAELAGEAFEHLPELDLSDREQRDLEALGYGGADDEADYETGGGG